MTSSRNPDLRSQVRMLDSSRLLNAPKPPHQRAAGRKADSGGHHPVDARVSCRQGQACKQQKREQLATPSRVRLADKRGASSMGHAAGHCAFAGDGSADRGASSTGESLTLPSHNARHPCAGPQTPAKIAAAKKLAAVMFFVTKTRVPCISALGCLANERALDDRHRTTEGGIMRQASSGTFVSPSRSSGLPSASGRRLCQWNTGPFEVGNRSDCQGKPIVSRNTS